MDREKEIREAVNLDGKSNLFRGGLENLLDTVLDLKCAIGYLEGERMKNDEAALVDDWYMKVQELQQEMRLYCKEYENKLDDEVNNEE